MNALEISNARKLSNHTTQITQINYDDILSFIPDIITDRLMEKNDNNTI